MTPSRQSTSRERKLLALIALGIIGTAACSAKSAATAQPSVLPSAPASSSAATGAAAQPPPRPGVSGEIAAIDGSTLQVQDGTAQTAVTFTKSTAITQSVPARLADVTVGACVNVTPVPDGSSVAPTAPPTAVAAQRVVISAPVDGRCGGGGGGGGGGFPGGGAGAGGSGAPGNRVRPSGAPSGAPAGFGGFGANGAVTSVSASGFVVSSPARGGAAPSSGTPAAPAAGARTVDVSVTSTTVFSKPQSATAAALKVGLCVTATGSTDTTGALTATALSLRTADATGCTTRRRAQPSSGTNG